MPATYGSDEYRAEVAAERARLEERYYQVWNTEEVQQHFEITGFLAPRCTAIHKETGIKGTLTFQHSPRFYFDFRPASENEYAIFKKATEMTVTIL